jgi:hypothetical protein
MDNAQYDKRFTNRNRILAPTGPIWLTVPIDKSQKFGKNAEVRVNNSLPWKQEHWKKLSYSYRNAKWFATYGPFFEEFYERDHEKLVDVDIETTEKLMQWLEIKIQVIRESELGVEGQGTERLVNICKAIGADTYVSGIGGRNYMEDRLFTDQQVKLEYQQYRPVPYRHRFVDEFIPDLSVVDMLFNMGPLSKELVRSQGEVHMEAAL